MTPDEIKAVLTDDGFVLASVLVRDEFNGREGQAVWAITITRNGQSLQTEYSAGCAHRHYRGGRKIQMGHLNPRTISDMERNRRSIPDKPQLAGVLYCIVSDAQCVSDGQTFEEFASELGYDEDSRKGEKAFNGCRDEFFGLQRLGANLDELSELFQDF